MTVEAGVDQRGEADAVGLALGVARKVELLLQRCGLAAEDRRLREVAARRAAGARREDREQQCADLDRQRVLLVAQHAGDVPLRDVADFVCEHAGEFGLGLRPQDEPAVYPDEPAWQREGVHHRIADDEELEVLRARRAERNELVAQAVDVFGRLRIGEVIRIAPDLRHDLLADPAFLRRRQFLGAGLTERRQLDRLCARRQCDRSRQHECEQQDDAEAQ